MFRKPMKQGRERLGTKAWTVLAFLVLAAGVLGFNLSKRVRWGVPAVLDPGLGLAASRQPATAVPPATPAADFSPTFLQMAFGDKPPLLERIQDALGQPAPAPPATVPLPAAAPVAARAAPIWRFARHFTLAEARALVPELREIFADAHASRARLEEAVATLDAQAARLHVEQTRREWTPMLRNLSVIKEHLDQLRDRGVVLANLERGAVDFPHLRDGREVFLCWELAEDDIEFWHELDAGCAGRERL